LRSEVISSAVGILLLNINALASAWGRQKLRKHWFRSDKETALKWRNEVRDPAQMAYPH
jgi:hypothetical protein